MIPWLLTVIGNIRCSQALVIKSGKIRLSVINRQLSAKLQQAPDEIVGSLVLFQQPPVKPCCRIVQTVGVVVSFLCVSELISHQKLRYR